MPKKKYEIPFLNEWINELESGRYKQGKQSLRNEKDQFCCLGVYCDILAKKGLGKWEHDEQIGWKYTFKDESEEGVLPSTVADLGFKSDQGIMYNSGTYGNRFLTQANDEGRSFKEIAKVIRNNCVELPTEIDRDGTVYIMKKL